MDLTLVWRHAVTEELVVLCFVVPRLSGFYDMMMMMMMTRVGNE